MPQLCRDAVRSHRPLAIFMLDVDDFKRYNDRFGHQQGDACLKEVAGALQRCLKEDQYLVRYGGEEFLCVIEGLDEDAALEMGNRFCQVVQALQLPSPVPNRCAWLTVSVGICCQVPFDETGWEELLHYADRALYLAKRRGKNQVVCAWLEAEEDEEEEEDA